MYYYPYANYKESRPSRLDLEKEDVRVIRGSARPSSDKNSEVVAVSDSDSEESVMVRGLGGGRTG